MIIKLRKLSLVAVTLLIGTVIGALSCGKSDDNDTVSSTIEYSVKDITTPIELEVKYGALLGTKVLMPAGTLPLGSTLKVSPAPNLTLPEGVTSVSQATNISVTQADGTAYYPISSDGIQIVTPIKMSNELTVQEFANAVAVAYSLPVLKNCVINEASSFAMVEAAKLKVKQAASISSFKSIIESPIELLGVPTISQQAPANAVKSKSPSLTLKVPTSGTFQATIKSSSNTSIKSGSMNFLRFASELSTESKDALAAMNGGNLSFSTLALTEGAPSIEIQTRELICESSSATTSVTYSVGGTISGLSGTVILQNNSSEDISLSSDGSFTFSTSLAKDADYLVTVKTQPTGQTCTISNGSGKILDKVTNVTVTCSSNTQSVSYTVGGTVSGLTGTVVLQNNSGNDTTVTSNGTFTFGTAIAKDADYLVTVKTQPAAQTCTIANGSGKISSNVTNVAVSCSTNTYLVTPSGSNVSITPSTAQSVSHGSTQAFTVTGNSGYLRSSTVGGSCPAGSWSGNQYTTGAISAACTVTFSGTQVKIIKLSATTTNGNLGASAAAAITAADNICGSGYKALLGNTARNKTTDWPLAASMTYVRADGTTIVGTTDSSKLFSTNLTNPISATSQDVWAGFISNWDVSFNNCTNWTSDNSGTHGGWGLANIQGENWFSWNSTSGVGGNCDNLYYLYCVQQ